MKTIMKRSYIWAGVFGAVLLLASCDAAERHAANYLQEQLSGGAEETDESEAEEEENEPEENEREETEKEGRSGRTDAERAEENNPRTIEEAVNQRIDQEKEKVRGHVDRILQDAHERAGQAVDEALGGDGR